MVLKQIWIFYLLLFNVFLLKSQNDTIFNKKAREYYNQNKFRKACKYYSKAIKLTSKKAIYYCSVWKI